jgi:hypothetical protein
MTPDSLDVDAFDAGVRDLEAIAPTGEQIRGQLAATPAGVSRLELDLHALSFGANAAAFPGPYPYWADAQEADSDRAQHLATLPMPLDTTRTTTSTPSPDAP